MRPPALGAVVGFERGWRRKPARLGTHMLTSMAAALLIVVSQEIACLPYLTEGGGETQVDPLRLVEAVTAGGAFLAAGVIFTSGGSVRNLKTGASMWLAGAIGPACGAGQVPLAVLATGLIVTVMVLVRWLERAMGTYEDDEERAPDGADQLRRRRHVARPFAGGGARPSTRVRRPASPRSTG